MRLSDIQGERTLEVIADIIDPIANIAEDDKASYLFHKEKLPDGMTAKKFLLQKARKAIPSLLKTHKEDILSILSTIDGTAKEEYTATLSLAKLTKDVIELLTDEAFITFFISAQSDQSSGSASENIEDPKAFAPFPDMQKPVIKKTTKKNPTMYTSPTACE